MTHEFLKLAGVDNYEDFYKKYKTEKSFFAAFPQARNGYTFDDPTKPFQEDLTYGGVQPTQVPQNARGNDVMNYQPNNIQDWQPSQYQQSSPDTSGGYGGASSAIQQGAKVAVDVIDGIGRFNRALQVGAPQLLNALIPDNQNQRTLSPNVATNQYAYGTGSQMMYENGGTIYEKDKDYTMTQQELQRLKDLGYEVEIY